jgi:hypothetical protein
VISAPTRECGRRRLAIKVYESIAYAPLDAGVEKLFGLMGDGNMRYLAA